MAGRLGLLRRGEVYLANFSQGRGHEQRGERPALVIQNDDGNEFASTTIVAALTAQRVVEYPFRVVLSPSETGLRETSTALLDQLLTLDMGRLRRCIGRLTPEAMLRIDIAIHRSLGLLH